MLRKNRNIPVLNAIDISVYVIITNMSDLSETDTNLLRMLQQDCRQPITEIAKDFGIPATTAYDKVKRMEERGIINGYVAMLDEEKLGLPTTALILVSIGYPSRADFSQEAVAERLSEFSEIVEVYIIAGDWDLMLKVKSKSIEDVGELVTKKIRNIEGISKTKTIAVFRKVKETPVLPI
ncbi:MAG: Lrp/AsnC family transcriptional regulator [Candidatus Thorarchaeota archaeon]